MREEYCSCCPDIMDPKNRFAPENRFIGDIEDGKRYPFDVYSKEEANERYNALDTRVTALEYEDIKINHLAATPAVCEMGSSNTVILTWELNKSATTQNINGEEVVGNTKIYTGITAPQTYTLIVSDGTTSTSEALTVDFANQIYYGALANITSATITSLQKVLSNEKARRVTVDAGTDKYIVYAIPSRLGNVVFYASGFEGGFENPVEYILTNSNGYRESYLMYRSTNAGLGVTTIEAREE